jgi:hypothetical protein
MTSDLSTIRDDNVVLEDGVMADVGVGHDQRSVPDAGRSRADSRSCVNGCTVPDLDTLSKCKASAAPNAMLSRAPEARAWVNHEARAGGNEPPKDRPRGDLSGRTEIHRLVHPREWIDRDALRALVR